MKIYIIEDDSTVVKILSNIIEDNDLGTVCGYVSDNAISKIEEILLLQPDIILVDLLMPDKDGIEIVKDLKDNGCLSKIIMISQVSSKSMIEKAYGCGIDFYISKPINVIEIKTIIRRVTDIIENEIKLNNIKNMFQDKNINISSNVDKTESLNNRDFSYKSKKILYILNKMGLSGEKGEKDIISICEFLFINSKSMSDISVNDICENLSDNPKTMEQRIRRAISKAMTNISNLGIEDYMNEIFIMYSASLFNFEDIKLQMDYIRGKRTYGGKINMKKFIDGLMLLSEN